ncbi:MAG: molecular chaperone DnaJ [Acidimicrobiales bacterium]
MAEDYYKLLGVSRGANEDEIKRAYRRLARQLHPDANPDAVSDERFKLVNRAYETLKDPERRRQYDMFGDSPRGSGGGDPFVQAGGLGDLFDAFFGGNPFGGAGPGGGGRSGRAGPRRGEDAEASIDLDFAEAVFGTERSIEVRLPSTCETCAGSGARPGTAPVTCATCGGAGEIRRVRQSILGQMVTASPCPRCGGRGEEIPSPCPDCRGEGRRSVGGSFLVEVPAGVDQGQTLRLPGRGAAGPRGGPAGDLFVHLRVRPHPTVQREGDELRATLHVAMTQATLGWHVNFDTLDGPEEIVVPPGTPSGRQMRLRSRGVPHLQSRGRGDLVVTIVVDTPGDLTKAQEDLMRQLAAERGEEVAGPESGLMAKIRGAFK